MCGPKVDIASFSGKGEIGYPGSGPRLHAPSFDPTLNFGPALELRIMVRTDRFVMVSPKEATNVKCLRIYATPDGESHFDEVEIPTKEVSVHPEANAFDMSASYPASRVRFTRIPAGMRQVDWHRVPDRVLTVRLDGSVEYGTSDGEVRKVAAGEFVLLEDTHGKGHRSRHSPEAQLVLWISLPEGLDEPL